MTMARVVLEAEGTTITQQMDDPGKHGRYLLGKAIIAAIVGHDAAYRALGFDAVAAAESGRD